MRVGAAGAGTGDDVVMTTACKHQVVYRRMTSGVHVTSVTRSGDLKRRLHHKVEMAVTRVSLTSDRAREGESEEKTDE